MAKLDKFGKHRIGVTVEPYIGERFENLCKHMGVSQTRLFEMIIHSITAETILEMAEVFNQVKKNEKEEIQKLKDSLRKQTLKTPND